VNPLLRQFFMLHLTLRPQVHDTARVASQREGDGYAQYCQERQRGSQVLSSRIASAYARAELLTPIQAGRAEEKERASWFMAFKSRKGSLDNLESALAAVLELVSIESIKRADILFEIAEVPAPSNRRGKITDLNKCKCRYQLSSFTRQRLIQDELVSSDNSSNYKGNELQNLTLDVDNWLH
jgi:hypothetical protein